MMGETRELGEADDPGPLPPLSLWVALPLSVGEGPSEWVGLLRPWVFSVRRVWCWTKELVAMAIARDPGQATQTSL